MDLFEEYKKTIPFLTILEENRQKFAIDALKNRSVHDEVALSKEIIDIKQKMEDMERELTLYRNDVIS